LFKVESVEEQTKALLFGSKYIQITCDKSAMSDFNVKGKRTKW